MEISYRLKQKAEVGPRPPAKSFDTKLPESDPNDEVERHKIEPTELSGLTFAIEYINSNGETSERGVTFLTLRKSNKGHVSILAKCHLRKTQRAFRIDRIQRIIDWSTGEVFLSFREFLSSMEIDLIGLEKGEVINPLKRCKNGIIFLSALAYSDEPLTPEELQVILLFCDDVHCSYGLQLSPSNINTIRKFVSSYTPSDEDIDTALDYFEKHPERAKLVMKYAKMLAAADNHISDEEMELLIELEDIIEELIDS